MQGGPHIPRRRCFGEYTICEFSRVASSMFGSGCAEHVQAYLRCSKGGDMAFSLYCWPSLILVAYWLSAYAVGLPPILPS